MPRAERACTHAGWAGAAVAGGSAESFQEQHPRYCVTRLCCSRHSLSQPNRATHISCGAAQLGNDLGLAQLVPVTGHLHHRSKPGQRLALWNVLQGGAARPGFQPGTLCGALLKQANQPACCQPTHQSASQPASQPASQLASKAACRTWRLIRGTPTRPAIRAPPAAAEEGRDQQQSYRRLDGLAPALMRLRVRRHAMLGSPRTAWHASDSAWHVAP